MDLETIHSLLSDYQYKHSDVPLSFRNITYYDEKGILRTSQTKSQKWRRYNGYDIIWINIVKKLRGMGLPTKMIAEVKERIFAPILAKVLADEMTIGSSFFECQVCTSIIKNDERSLLIYNDLSHQYYVVGTEEIWREMTFISVPFSLICKKQWKDMRS